MCVCVLILVYFSSIRWLIFSCTLLQTELHESTPHLGIYNETSRSMLKLLTNMLNLKWDGSHACDKEDEINECLLCEVSAIWYQLAVRVMEFIAPRDALKLPVKDLPKVDEFQHRKHTESQSKPCLFVCVPVSVWTCVCMHFVYMWMPVCNSACIRNIILL